jgi:DNA-binding Lrp family transcriptional regulator
MKCCLMTADTDWLLRAAVPGAQSLARFIVNHLSKIPGSASIQSSIALKQVEYRTALRLARSTRRN